MYLFINNLMKKLLFAVLLFVAVGTIQATPVMTEAEAIKIALTVGYVEYIDSTTLIFARVKLDSNGKPKKI